MGCEKHAIPTPVKTKIYKTGQTRGADDDVIYQNRVGRNSTVLFQLSEFELCKFPYSEKEKYDNGFIVLIKPEDYFDNPDFNLELSSRDLVLGENALLFYETRDQWNKYDPFKEGYVPASSRIAPLKGQFVARVPSTTASDSSKIIEGFNSSKLKGAGIRVYEYASKKIIDYCKIQLEFLYWSCFDSVDFSLLFDFKQEDILKSKDEINKLAQSLGLADCDRLVEARILDKEGNTICPLCLKKISARSFCTKISQAVGREVPDLTVTEASLFHIKELRTGEYNHRPYNLGWGHHHCNVVVKDSGINETIEWMKTVIENNEKWAEL